MRLKILSALLLFSSFSTAHCDNQSIRIELFKGNEIQPHIQNVVKLCHKIYESAPYFYKGDDAEYEDYLNSYSQTDNAVTCLVFNGERAIGLGVGLPLSESRDFYKFPLLKAGFEPDNLFYIGEFGLDSSLQDLGIEEMMYLEIENFAKHHNYHEFCIWEIQDPANTAYNPIDEFWNELGFVTHPEINFHLSWVDIGKTEPTSHKAIYKIKTQ